jgi:predicted nucleotidyltransferase
MVALPLEISRGIVDSLRPLDPRRIVLFGSRAQGETVHPDSDIDLVVVLGQAGRPRDYREKMANTLAVRRSLREINRAFSLDTLVFTEEEWEEFQRRRPEFADEIVRTGIVLA